MPGLLHMKQSHHCRTDPVSAAMVGLEVDPTGRVLHFVKHTQGIQNACNQLIIRVTKQQEQEEEEQQEEEGEKVEGEEEQREEEQQEKEEPRGRAAGVSSPVRQEGLWGAREDVLENSSLESRNAQLNTRSNTRSHKLMGTPIRIHASTYTLLHSLNPHTLTLIHSRTHSLTYIHLIFTCIHSHSHTTCIYSHSLLHTLSYSLTHVRSHTHT